MTVVELHNSQGSMPCKCTLATYFIHDFFALTCIYIQHLHVVSFSQIRLIKQGLVIRPYTASWGNGTSNCTYGHMLFVGYRIFKETISAGFRGTKLNEKYVRKSATWPIVNQWYCLSLPKELKVETRILGQEKQYPHRDSKRYPPIPH
jgi:hypothetical protein